MALGSTHPLTKISTRNISRGLKGAVRRADNLATFICRLSINYGSLDLLEPSGPAQACTFTYVQ